MALLTTGSLSHMNSNDKNSARQQSNTKLYHYYYKSYDWLIQKHKLHNKKSKPKVTKVTKVF